MAAYQQPSDQRPLLVYDDACSVCRTWVRYWRLLTHDKVIYAPFPEVADELPYIAREKFTRSIHFIDADGTTVSGAYAACKILDHAPGKGLWLWLYRFLPGFALLAEAFYKFLLLPHPTVERLATWLWSAPPPQAEYRLISGVFLRLLALIYLVAFTSIGIQIVGLAGSDGVLPFANALHRAEQAQGIGRYWFYPTLFWISASDAALQAVAAGGCVLAILLFLGIWQRLCLVLLFVFYLSLFHAGWPFMNFQWDYLLLEAGFLAIFLPGGSRIVIWLFRWLLFRFRFLSGVSKLLSQDPTWSGLTALNFYFETQPLPHLGSWIAHQLPEWLLKFGTGATLFIEIVVPFMIFLPRGPRFIAAWATIALQLLIILTSNHNFVNFLTIALCLFLFDDRALSRIVPSTLAHRLSHAPKQARFIDRRGRDYMVGLLAGIIVFTSGFQIWEMFSGRPSPEPAATVLEHLKPFHIVNKYHVFPVIKTERMELIIEGSDDGEHWKPYSFKYKPGDVKRRPEIVIPHQPRLDWMLWFAHMGYHPMMQTWLEGFLDALLRDSPSVMALLETNPFPERSPRYLRIEVYRYRFSDLQTLRDTDQWWKREYMGPYYPMPWRQRHLSPQEMGSNSTTSE